MYDDTADSEADPVSGLQRRTFLHDDLKEEYYKLADIVNTFDQRLLTIKGWGVTFSLATTALAFQQTITDSFLLSPQAPPPSGSSKHP
jgi:hypothetical protein